MLKRWMNLLACLAAMAVAACAAPPAEPEADNPLLAPLSGPYGGVPQFQHARLADLRSAVEQGIAAHLAEIDAIAANPEPPDFENTIVAFERSGRELDRAFIYWSIWSSNMSTPEFRELQRELAPRLAAYTSSITQNRALFERIRAVHTGSEPLRPDQRRLVALTYDTFARNGATLDGEAAARFAEINRRLAELHTQFANNVLHDEEAYVTWLTADQLGGLPPSVVGAYAAAAERLGRPGEYAVANTRSAMDPFLTYSAERGLREAVWRTYYDRGANGDEYDNHALIAEILQLRHERVRLLGYDNYAQWRLEDRMAATPERAMALMEAVWPSAVARVHEEVADMQALADARGDEIVIEPWDYRYYMELIRQARYELDSNELRQYLQLDNLLQAMFFVAGELFGYAFTPVPAGSVPVWHEDVTVYEVTDRNSGEHVGLWYLDPFARAGKRSGAWASSFRGHSTFDGPETPLSTNNSNFVEPAPGTPVLVSWDDAKTFFHEFGHALHTLSSAVAYPGLNSGVRDYTEFHSQLLERWLLTPPVVERYLLHVETGEPMPAELVARIQAAATFNQGFATTEYLASALVDMHYHTADPAGIDPEAFERETLARLGMPDELPMRHRSPHFSHIFAGEGYAAGYYGYLWADVLTSDAAEAFAAAPGGFYDEALAGRLVEHLFAPRNSVDPAEAYRRFRGRDPDIAPLMRDRGFPFPGDEKDLATATQTITPAAIRADIVTLASPQFEGRAPATPGEDATVAFISGQFAAAGVAPGIGGSYVQPLELVEFRPDAGGVLAVEGPAGPVTLVPTDDYVLTAGKPAPALAVRDSRVVIGGFGIRAGESDWDDYAGVDLAGSTVLLFRGDPGTATGDPALFGGHALSEHGLVGAKAELAAALGATAVLLVHTDASAGFPWQTLAGGGASGAQYSLPDGPPRLTLFAHVSESAARRLVTAAGLDYDAVLAAAAVPGFSAIPTDLSVSGELTGDVSSIVTRNIVGMVRGSQAPHECIVYTAHWDHMGVNPGADTEDKLFNGAVDNATGTAMLMAIARAYASLPVPPRRSVYFFATAAEERGLLGAQHFVDQPPCETRNIVAALNMDAHFPYSDRWDAMVVPGLGTSGLTAALEDVATRYGRVLIDDPNPAAGGFFRSDHYPFIKAGVPGLFAVGAPTAAQLEADPRIGEGFAWYMANGYHHAADEVDRPYPWRLGGLTDDARIFFELGWRLANSDTWPNFAEETRWRAVRDEMRGEGRPGP